MSRENVEVVERWYAAYNDRDLDEVLALMHPKISATSAGMSGVEGAEHVGHAGIRRYFADLWETWEDPKVVPEHCLDHGDTVVMLGHTTGRGRLSGIEVEFPVATVIDVEDGVITRYRTYREWDEALAQVGESASTDHDR